MVQRLFKRWSLALVSLSLLLTISTGWARETLFPTEKPHIFAMEDRNHRFHHGFVLGTGVIPNDPVFVAFLLHASYQYQFNQLWGWTILDGFYGQNVDTGLTGYLARYGARPLDQALQNIRAGIGTHFVLRPLYGKMAWFNQSKVEAMTSLYLGPGAILGNDYNGQAFYFAPYAGIAMDFWFAKHFSLRFDIRDYVAINLPSVNNLITLLMGITLQFGLQDAHPIIDSTGIQKDDL